MLSLILPAAMFYQVASASPIDTVSAVQWQESTAPANPLPVAGVPNFGKLNLYIWRSGQPTRAGYETLARDGLKAVVNLNAENPGDSDLLPASVRYFPLPVGDWHAPTVTQADRFLAIVNDPNNWPVLVHCRAGKGRTGLMSALVRYSRDGWPEDSIKTEIRNFRKTKWWIFTFTLPLSPIQSGFLEKWEKNHLRGYLIDREKR